MENFPLVPFFSNQLSVFFDTCRWKLNDSFIQPRPGSRFSLTGGNLHISRLNKEEDVGIYQCLASNSFGTIVSREASLHIACKYSAAAFIAKILQLLVKKKRLRADNSYPCTRLHNDVGVCQSIPFSYQPSANSLGVAKHSLTFGLLPSINDHLPRIDLFLVTVLPVSGNGPHYFFIHAHRYYFLVLILIMNVETAGVA